MNLFLVRHGEARGKEEDPARGLSRRGIETVRSVAMDFSLMNPGVGRILHSGKLRAQQTAEILAELLRIPDRLQELPDLEPEADVSRLLPRINRLGEDTMLVGHLPHLSRLTSALLTGNPDLELVRLQPGGIVCLSRPEAGLKAGWLIEWMIRPVVPETA